MKKIKGKTSIWEKGKEKEEKNIEGFLFNNKIVYKEKDILVKVFIKEKEIKLTRIHKDYEIELNFKKNKKSKGKYILKKENIFLDLDIITKELENNKNKIRINYETYIEKEQINNNIWILNYEVIK